MTVITLISSRSHWPGASRESSPKTKQYCSGNEGTMAKKNDQQPAVENERPAPVGETSEGLHDRLRAARRQLEAELASVDEKIRDAVNAGDVAALESLTCRKAELPKLFIAASLAETNARHYVFNAEDEANLNRLHAAEAERDTVQAALDDRRREVEAELAEMAARLQEANRRVGEAYSTITASRDLGGACDAGFQRSLAALAGM